MSAYGLSNDEIAERLGLSDEQRRALGLEEDTVVAAGAGAGKTTTLVAAVAADLLAAEVDPQRICVCTFTRAAAANLQARLAAKLSELVGERAPDTSELWVGTIDSICARFLRQHAFAAGLSPNFSVADERQLRPLRRQALTEALDELDDHELRTIAGVVEPDNPKFLKQVSDAHEQLRALGMSRPRVDAPQPFAGYRELLKDLQALCAHEQLTSVKAEAKITSDIVAVERRDLDRLSDFRYGLRKKQLKELYEDLLPRLEAFRLHLIDERSREPRLVLAELLADYGRRYERLRHESELVDFAEMAERTLQAARDGVGGFSGFERLYVDEAQDTSPIQLELLRQLRSDSGTTIYVGDALQSIYGFRGADVDNFRRATAKLKRVTLADNYRSRPSVLRAVNAVCSRLPHLSQELIRMRSAGPKSDEPAGGGPTVEVAVTSKPKNAPSATDEARTLVPAILDAAGNRGLDLADVCVLVRSNEEVEAFAAAFRALGLPALAIRKRGLLSRPECLDVVAYLRLVAWPDDEEALLRVLSSPFYGADDERLRDIARVRRDELWKRRDETNEPPKPGEDGYVSLLDVLAEEEPEFYGRFRSVSEHRSKIGVAELARRAIETHRYDVALGLLDETGAAWRNVEKLLRLIEQLERDHAGPNLRRVVELLEDERDHDGEEGPDISLPAGIDAVRVMTIHQAKGDEFPLVAVCRLSRQGGPSKGPLWIADDGRLGLTLPKANSDGNGALRDTVAQQVCDQSKADEEAETWRLLYVALTRAEEHLLLGAAGTQTKNGLSWRGPFASIVADQQLPDPDREGTVSFSDSEGAVEVPVRHLRLQTKSPAAGRRKLKREAKATGGELELSPIGLPALTAPTVSYSALSAWRRCGLRRHLEAELGLRELPGAAADAEANGGDARRFGIKVHRALALIDWATAKVDDDFSLLLGRSGLQGQSAERASKLIRTALSSPLAERLRCAEDVKAERAFQVRVGTRLVTGKVDLLARMGNEALVIDWKSGADEDDVFAADYALQRRIYAVAVLRSPDAPQEVSSVSCSLADGQMTSERWTTGDLAGLERQLTERIEDIESQAPQPAATERQPFCEGCPGLARICPVSRALAAQAEAEPGDDDQLPLAA